MPGDAPGQDVSPNTEFNFPVLSKAGCSLCSLGWATEVGTSQPSQSSASLYTAVQDGSSVCETDLPTSQ